MKTKTRKSSAARSVRGLPVKTIAAKTAKGVRGGSTSVEHTSSPLGGKKAFVDKLTYPEVKIDS